MRRARWNVRIVAPRRQKDGNYWIIRARPPRGLDAKELRKSTFTTDRAEAEHEAAALESQLNAALELPRDPTFEELYRSHLAAMEAERGGAENTRRNFRNALPALSRTPLWTARCSALDRPLVVRSQDTLKLSLRASTINNYIDLVRLTWKWGLERGLVTRPWPEVKRLSKKACRTEKRPFSDREVMLVLAAVERRAGGRWLPFFTLQADTGARIDALCKLRGADVRRDRNEVVLRTKGETVIAPVPPETIALLPDAKGDEYLFATREGEPVRRETPYGVFSKALRDAGIADPERLDTHSFRRAWVTTAQREGVPLAIGMRVTGHKSPDVHMRYQQNAADYPVHEAVRRVREARLRAIESLPSSLPTPGGVGRVEEGQAVAGSERPEVCQLLTS